MNKIIKYLWCNEIFWNLLLCNVKAESTISTINWTEGADNPQSISDCRLPLCVFVFLCGCIIGGWGGKGEGGVQGR